MSSPGKDFHIDAVYPEHLSRLRRGAPKADLLTSSSYRRSARKQLRKGNSGRFRTQPVTFHEIKEVDEDNLVESEDLGSVDGRMRVGSTSKSESDLKAKFELFYKSITRESGIVTMDSITESKTSSNPSSSTSAMQIGKSGTTTDSSGVTTVLPPVGFNTRSRPSL